MASAPPVVFSPARRLAARKRAVSRQFQPDAARYVLEDMIDDAIERLAFVRHEPCRVLVMGDLTGRLARELGCTVIEADPATGFADDMPFPFAEFDLVVSLGLLDTTNDPIGALIHIRNALAPGGLALCSLMGAGSLPALRAAMLEADGERPAPRLHPMIDVRAGGQLLQRAGWADPVVDSRAIDVRFSSLDRLVGDLRDQGLTNVLARHGSQLGRPALARARAAFGERTVDRFEIVTLSGWRR